MGKAGPSRHVGLLADEAFGTQVALARGSVAGGSHGTMPLPALQREWLGRHQGEGQRGEVA